MRHTTFTSVPTRTGGRGDDSIHTQTLPAAEGRWRTTAEPAVAHETVRTEGVAVVGLGSDVRVAPPWSEQPADSAITTPSIRTLGARMP